MLIWASGIDYRQKPLSLRCHGVSWLERVESGGRAVMVTESRMKKVHPFIAALLKAQNTLDIVTKKKSSEGRQQGGSIYNCPHFMPKESLS